LSVRFIKENLEYIIKDGSTGQLLLSMVLVNCGNPYLGYQYNVSTEKSGVIRYQNNTDCMDGAVLLIKADDAEYIIGRIMAELFCYDTDEHDAAIIDGYHWEIMFYRKDELIDRMEGWPNYDTWRYGRSKGIVEFAEIYSERFRVEAGDFL